MGGEGSISAMITSLRNNALLRRKKTPFEDEKGYFQSKKGLLKPDTRKIEVKPLSEEERAHYKQLTIRSNRIRSIKITSALVVIVIIVVASSILIINKLHELAIKREQVRNEIMLTRKTEEYNKYVTEARTFMQYEEWAMAIWQLRKAVETLPNQLEAKLLLVDSYVKSCTANQEYCYDGIHFITGLINQYPQNTKLYELRSILYDKTGQVEKALIDLEYLSIEY